MPKGVSLQLFNDATAVASETGITALWWDVEPINFEDPIGKSNTVTTDASGYISLDLDDLTALAVGEYGYLLLHKNDGTDYKDSPTFFGKVAISTITSGVDMYYYDPEWTRPADWLTLPVLAGTEQTVHMLIAVEEDPVANGIAFTASGAYTVDWGDGVTENFTSGTTATHQYDYADTDLDGTLTSDGFKQAIITVTPQAAQNLTALGMQVKYLAGYSANYVTPLLDLEVSMPNATTSGLVISAFSATVRHSRCRRVAIRSWGATNTCASRFNHFGALREVYLPSLSAVTTVANMFDNCCDLKAVPRLTFGSGLTTAANMCLNCTALKRVPRYVLPVACTTVANMFQGCRSLRSFPGIDATGVTTASQFLYSDSVTFGGALAKCGHLNLPACQNFGSMFASHSALETGPEITMGTGVATSFASMFYGCAALKSCPVYPSSAVTNFSSMFNACRSLQVAPALNTAAGTNFGSMFSACYGLYEIPALNLSAGTSFSSFLSNCPSLSSFLATGATYAISFQNCRLSAAALNTMYTNLGTAAGAQTVTVTGNFGVTGDDPTIATAKGWTVSG